MHDVNVPTLCMLITFYCARHHWLSQQRMPKQQRRFQIYKKLGVKFYDLFLLTERLQRNFNYFTVNLPLDFSEIFNIFRITVFLFFLRIQKNFRKKLKTIVISKPVDERSNNFQENHSLWMPTIWYQAKLFNSSSL